MKQKNIRYLTSAAALVAFAGTARSEVKLPALFSDNMVLQRQMPVVFWGTADPGEVVSVASGKQKATTMADGTGRWKLTLKPLAEGGPHQITVSGKNEISLRNVAVGEVWLASGQSNMEWPVSLSQNAESEIKNARYPDIRMFTVPFAVSAEPSSEAPGSWQAATSENVGSFSAVGYYFARELQQRLGVPVGIIHSAVGGTYIEAWMSDAALRSDPDFAPILQRQVDMEKNYPSVRAEYERKLAEWQKAAEAARAEGKPEPDKPTEPVGPVYIHRPSGLFNGKIAPLMPYTVRGVIWYQGESNAARAYQYRKLLPTLIRDWRTRWNQDFPFYIVQLANYTQRAEQPVDDAWAELREAQAMALSLPKTALAVTIDIGEAGDIHPKNKQEVGRRLALPALSQIYGRKMPFSGPLLRSSRVEGKTLRLSFKHTEGGLVLKNADAPSFAIAGEDRKWHWAQARIEGRELVVWSDAVEKPVAVRYAWAANPAADFYNGAGLPAVPFRTDDWPIGTQNAK